VDEATHVCLFPRTDFFSGTAAALSGARRAGRAEAGALHHDLMRPVREAIEGAVCQDRIVEERNPLLDHAVARDDRRRARCPGGSAGGRRRQAPKSGQTPRISNTIAVNGCGVLKQRPGLRSLRCPGPPSRGVSGLFPRTRLNAERTARSPDAYAQTNRIQT
jgi:hypothetical protein